MHDHTDGHTDDKWTQWHTGDKQMPDGYSQGNLQYIPLHKIVETTILCNNCCLNYDSSYFEGIQKTNL